MREDRQESADLRVLRPYLLAAFFISGANGLAFEMLFRRFLQLSLGVTHYATGVVLTIFMAGLGLGSVLFGRIADNRSNGHHDRHAGRRGGLLLLYGALEVGIGLLSLGVLALTPSLDAVYRAFVTALGSPESGNIAVKALMGGIVLLPVTLLMGGTLPVLAKLYTGRGEREGGSEENAGMSLGLLYGLNTLGGVAGTLGAGFFLISALGASHTVLLFAAASVALGGCFVLLSTTRGEWGKALRRDGGSPEAAEPAAGKARRAKGAEPGIALPLAGFAVAGFVGLSVEVYWTRILAYVIGSHGYAFSIILASFLSGLGCGSILCGTMAKRVRKPQAAQGMIMMGVGGGILLTTLLLYGTRGLAGKLSVSLDAGWQGFILAEMTLLFLILLAPTFLMGCVFPLVMAAVVRDYGHLGGRVGRAYGLNVLGSIAGSFAGSFLLIEFLGISRSVRLSALLSMAVGFVLLMDAQTAARRRVLSVAALTAGVFLALVAPLQRPLQQLGPAERLLFYEESGGATVSVREDARGERMLSINGLDEVPVDPSSLLTFRMLAHLPMLLHPHPRDVMVLSLGGGITTGSVARHDVERIDVVELVPAVVRAASYFTPWNGGVLDDPRLNVILQDGRNYLLVADRTYDVITADATHPWSADSWILYTEEFYRLVRSALAPEGVFCQWVPLHYLSEADYRCILRTMRRVFPHLSLWYTGSYTVALGSLRPPRVDVEEMEEAFEEPAVLRDLEEVGIGGPALLMSLFLMADGDIDRFVGEGPLNRDDRAFLEHSAARSFGYETTPVNLESLLAALGDDQSPPAEIGSREFLRGLLRRRGELIEARIATYEGRFEESMGMYRDILERFPSDGIARMFLADAGRTYAASLSREGDRFRQEGRLEDAERLYRRALELDADQPRAHNGLGLIYYGRERYGEALAQFDAALEEMGAQIQIRYNKTLALLRMGRLDEAREEIDVIEKLEADMDLRLSGELMGYLRQAGWRGE